MTPEQFDQQRIVLTHPKPNWLQWYEVGMPAVLVAGIQSSAQAAYRSFATDKPKLLPNYHTSDLFAVLRHFKSFRAGAGARNVPNWAPEFQQAWAETMGSGQPFCMADVVGRLTTPTKNRFAQLFLEARLETEMHPNGLEYNTGVDSQHNHGAIGTLRAAMWLEFSSEVRARVRSHVETWSQEMRDPALAKLAELDTIPVARYQLDWRTFGSYRRLSEQFDGFYDRWVDLPLAYKTPILDFVYQKATLDGLDASEYSSHNLFSRCSSYPEAFTFCRWVQNVHSKLDTSRLDWLLELSKLEPDPEKVAENWGTLQPKLAEVLDAIGRHTLAGRVRGLHV